MFWSSWSFWLYLAALAPYLGCTIFYGFRSPWRRSIVGKGLMALYGSLTAVLALVVLTQTGLLPAGWRDGLRAVTVGGVAIAGWVQLANIVRLQRCDRRDVLAGNLS